MKPLRLAIVATHPIQYHAPLFRCLADRGIVQIKVFFGWEGLALNASIDRGFGIALQWDIPLLAGYEHDFVPNRARNPGTHHFWGLDNPDMVARLLAWRPDAVLVFGWAWRTHLQSLVRLHGRLPVLFRGDSTLLDEQPGPRMWLRRAWLRWVYRHVDLALYVGSHNREYFRAHGIPETRLVWAPHSIDNARFADADGKHAEAARTWRKRLGIGRDEQVVLFAGKIEAQKGPAVLLEAFSRLLDAGIHLVFVGAGPLETSLRQLSAGSRNVHFLGFQNQSAMPVVYRMAQLFVLPSASETWGLAVNEAMACGLPVVVSDRVGCAPDLVREGENGGIFRAGDCGQLLNVLQGFLADPELLGRMGEASMRVVDGWSIEAQAARIEAAVAIVRGAG